MSPYERTVYYHDTDAAGVVYYARYLDFLEEARTVFFTEVGVNIVEWHHQGIYFVVRECRLVYKKPARYGEILVCQTSILRMTRTRILIKQVLEKQIGGLILVEADTELVCVSGGFKPTSIPFEIRRVFVPLND
jgi:acyl-CoA thioester hydrolase